MIHRFNQAVTLLTRIPLNTDKFQRNFRQVTIFFPVVGLIIGLILNAFYHLGKLTASVEVSTILILLTWVLITGAFHLDGLADTFDGFYGGNSIEDRLRIMKDSHIGAMGAISLIIILISKTVFLFAILNKGINISSILLVTPMISRFQITYIAYQLPYARPGTEGVAEHIKRDQTLSDALIASIITLVTGLVLYGVKFIGLFILTCVLTKLFSKYVYRRVGGMTGDILGATCEMTETISLMYLLI